MRKYIFGLFLLIAVLLMLRGPGTPVEQLPPPNPHLDSLVQGYELFLEENRRKHRLPGFAVALVRGADILYLKGFGIRKVGKRKKVDIHTVFRIGSLSKGFAAILAGKLAEDGFLSLEDQVVKHLPDFRFKSVENSRKVRISHLLSHTSGLPYHTYTNLVEHGKAIEDIAKEFRKIATISPPGAIYSYQNASFSLIAPLIRRTTGLEYNRQLQEKIFVPLGMSDASVTFDGIAGQSNYASPHRGTAGQWHPTELTDKYYQAVPAGGINASISDMAQWLIALLGHQPAVLSPAVLNEAFTPRVVTPIKSRYFRNWPEVDQAWYALGWRAIDYAGDTLIYHGGSVNGFRAELMISRREQIGLCILSNAPSRFANEGIPAFLDRYRLRKDSIHAWEKRMEMQLPE